MENTQRPLTEQQYKQVHRFGFEPDDVYNLRKGNEQLAREAQELNAVKTMHPAIQDLIDANKKLPFWKRLTRQVPINEYNMLGLDGSKKMIKTPLGEEMNVHDRLIQLDIKYKQLKDAEEKELIAELVRQGQFPEQVVPMDTGFDEGQGIDAAMNRYNQI